MCVWVDTYGSNTDWRYTTTFVDGICPLLRAQAWPPREGIRSLMAAWLGVRLQGGDPRPKWTLTFSVLSLLWPIVVSDKWAPAAKHTHSCSAVRRDHQPEGG